MKPIRIAAFLFLVIGFFLGSSAWAQTVPPPADIPVSHISISASFNGYDSKGKMLPSTIDTLGVAVYRNTAATQGFNVAYEHIAIPDVGQRWELGLGSYWFTLPKVKNILFDTSNFVFTFSAGAGKLLSASDGNHFAYTVAPSVTYPIAGHMSWTASYQYVRATGGGGIAGNINKSYSTIGTGPEIHF